MTKLLYYLTIIGYADLCCSFNPLTLKMESWTQAACQINNKTLKKFYFLLLLNHPIRSEYFNRKEKELLAPLVEEGIITCHYSFYQTRKLSLYVSMGHWFFFETPNLNPAIYYGDDSFALLNRLTAIKQKNTLDLCSGPGIQAIISSYFSERVTSVEINPISSGVASVNKKLNNIKNWDILTGNLYTPLPKSEKFDYIVANPPLLPFPRSEFYPFVGHGGEDGWEIIWEILRGLPQYLAPGGIAKITGTTLSSANNPIVIHELERWCAINKINCLFTIISQCPINDKSGIIASLILSTGAEDEDKKNKVSNSFRELIAEKKATHLISHILTLSYGKGEVQIINLSNNKLIDNFWFI